MESRRSAARAARPVNRDSFIQEWPEAGLVLFHSPSDPQPSVRVEQGRIVELDGTPEALAMQARIAEECGRPQLAENLRRAAELTRVPEPFILDVYRALRPGRADRDTLLREAAELQDTPPGACRL